MIFWYWILVIHDFSGFSYLVFFFVFREGRMRGDDWTTCTMGPTGWRSSDEREKRLTRSKKIHSPRLARRISLVESLVWVNGEMWDWGNGSHFSFGIGKLTRSQFGPWLTGWLRQLKWTGSFVSIFYCWIFVIIIFYCLFVCFVSSDLFFDLGILYKIIGSENYWKRVVLHGPSLWLFFVACNFSYL